MSDRPLPRWRRGVREAIYDHVYGSPAGEVGGVLVGEIPESGPVRISAAIPALQAEGERASVTFTHDAWAEVHAEIEKRHKGKRIVGWYHSHPGFGIFLSEHDLFIQRNFFSDPAQVAYVVDPHASTEGLFGWVDGDIAQVAASDTPRDPVRIAVPAEVAPNLVRRRQRQLWVTALWCFVAGLVVGGVIWFAALRPTNAPAEGPTGPEPAAIVTGTTGTAGTDDVLPTGTTTLPATGTTEAATPEPAPDATNTQRAPTPPPPESDPSGAATGKPDLAPAPARPPRPNSVQPPAPNPDGN